MPEYIRVKDKDTKHEYSIVDVAFDEAAHQKLRKPATSCDGEPLPPKHHATLPSADTTDPDGDSNGHEADDKKEEAK